MPTDIKGPGIFLAQFAGDAKPFNSFDSITKWAGSIGYKGVQVPTWDGRLFDLKKAAESKTYCDELNGIAKQNGVEITELSTHLQGHLVAIHPTYDEAVDGFAPAAVQGNTRARQEWACEQIKLSAKASQNLGITRQVSFTGALAWPFLYPWPPRPPGLVEEAFKELGKRWKPLLDVLADHGVKTGFELHPGEDTFDGTTFEMFLEQTGNHPSCGINYDPSHFLLQQMDYVEFIHIYHERIFAYHVKDAEFNPSGRQGVYSGFQNWTNRAGRFRSLGDGQVDFSAIFSALAQHNYDSWAVLEWECCLKDAEQGAREGAPFIEQHIIKTTAKAFDDFAAGSVDTGKARRMLGLK
jgi:sugar phosphate isomerase/epimerase